MPQAAGAKGDLAFGTSAGTDCGNTGEMAAIGLHELGHGLDSHDGSGPAGELGTGETYGDITAALLTRDSCIGEGFLLSGNCSGYGDACTQCSGVRDIDWGRHASGAPHTVANFIQPLCPPTDFYVGPCGAHALATRQPEKIRAASRRRLQWRPRRAYPGTTRSPSSGPPGRQRRRSSTSTAPSAPAPPMTSRRRWRPA